MFELFGYVWMFLEKGISYDLVCRCNEVPGPVKQLDANPGPFGLAKVEEI